MQRRTKPLYKDFDRTGSRVAAVQRALRTAQHFDTLEVEEAGARTLRARDVLAVEVVSGGRVADRDHDLLEAGRFGSVLPCAR